MLPLVAATVGLESLLWNCSVERAPTGAALQDENDSSLDAEAWLDQKDQAGVAAMERLRHAHARRWPVHIFMT